MRVSPLNTNPAAASGTRTAAAEPGTPVAQAEGPPEAAAPLRRGLSNWRPQLNQQLSNAQQAFVFLDQIDNQLQALKSEISAALTAYPSGDPGLAEKLQRFADLWQQRQAASGGSLDGQLAFSGSAEARQRFRVRGLDLRTLQSGDKETLVFSVGGPGQRLLPVAVEPDLTPDEVARRFSLALAPAGVAVTLGDDGTLGFSVPESAWPEVRDTMAVKGAGIRFPGGQLNRVKIESDPEAVRPQAWQSDDPAGLRRTLQEVLHALERIRHARDMLGRAMADVRSRLNEPASSSDQDWAFSFATEFAALALQPSYQIYSAVAPALVAISRDRVQSLLALD